VPVVDRAGLDLGNRGDHDPLGHERIGCQPLVELGTRNAVGDDRAALASGDRDGPGRVG
jgi:hypothetical protein